MALGRPEPTQRAGRGGGPPACQGPPHRVYSLGPGAAGSPPRKLQDRVSAPPGTTGACDLLGSHSCLCPPGRGTKGCWLRPRPAEAWAVAQGASGRPSPLLTPALQLGLWSLRWHAWLGSPAAEAAEGSRGLPLRRAGWAESLSGQKHTEQVGDAGRPSGTASRPFLSSPNTREEREPWDGGLPCPAQPPEQQRPGRSGGPPPGAGQGAPLGQPHNGQTGARAPGPTEAREGPSTHVRVAPARARGTTHRGTHCRSRFSWHLWSRTAGPSMLGCPGGPGEGAEDSTRASPRSQQLGPPPWSSFRGPR